MRFVVLHHTGWSGRPDHYDLMIQTAPGADDDDRVLATFSTPADIFPDGVNGTELNRVEPHRRMYLNFEGEIGSDRGVVKRIDEGFVSGKLLPGYVKFQTLIFFGRRLKGLYSLSLDDHGRQRFEKVP